MLDGLGEQLKTHIFPARADGADARLCPSCNKGQLSLKLGKFGAFIGCSNYPECRFTRVLAPNGQDGAGADGERPGVRTLGIDPATGDEITLRSGRFGDYVQQGEGEKPKRSSLPKGLSPDDLTLEKAIALLSLPREIAKHPTSGEPILAGIGRYGSYVQHGKTYANLGKDDDVLEIGGNRAIDLIVAKESGAGQPRFGAGSGRALGEHPTLGGAVSVKQGRFGAYVNHGKVNATLPKGTSLEALTLDEAVAALAAKAAGGGGGGRMLGEHPDGGPITVRDGRYGPMSRWGRVNATIFVDRARRDHPAGRDRADRGARGQASQAPRESPRRRRAPGRPSRRRLGAHERQDRAGSRRRPPEAEGLRRGEGSRQRAIGSRKSPVHHWVSTLPTAPRLLPQSSRRTSGRSKGDGIEASRQARQAFPNLACFCSKYFQRKLWRFCVKFQGVTSPKT